MYFSGFEGDSKEEMFREIQPGTVPTTVYIRPGENIETIICKMKTACLDFPVAVKPDVGTKGLLFRRIQNKEQLTAYHALMPMTYLIQEMITLPLELSIFYVRYPGEMKGIITGLIAKEYLHVKGDGRSTLKELIEKHPKAFMMAHEQKHKHAEKLDVIPAEGEIYHLNELGNHNRGATFTNLANEIDDALLCIMNRMNLYSKHFYYGRYDVKTTSIEDMKNGKNISILEFNGVGSEPNHIHDIGLSYMQAMRIIAKHWKYMYEIGRINCKNGINYISFWQGIRMLRSSLKHTKLMKQLDLQCKI